MNAGSTSSRVLVLALVALVGFVVGRAGAEAEHDVATAESPDRGALDSSGETEARRGPSIVLLSIDDLRRDRLEIYGNPRKTAPALAKLAAQSVVFDNAYATSSWTLPSHASMFTGLYPQTHRAQLQMTALRDDVPVLAEILQAEGYRTIGVTAGGWVSEGFGFARGFDEFETIHPLGRAVTKVIAELEKIPNDEPFFLFFHTFGVHCPFVVFPKYSEEFDTRPTTDHLDLKGKCGDTDFQQMELTDGQIAFVSDRYDAGIRATDDRLKRLFDYLGQRGDAGPTILVVTSDHGEEFREHGRMGHGRALYAETLRIPLAIRAPGVEPGRARQLTSLVDLTPTLLGLAGFPAIDAEGENMAPLLRGEVEARAARPIFAETNLRGEKARSVLFEGKQLIVNLKAGKTELFDLSADPGQRRPLGDEDGATRQRLESLLEENFSVESMTPPSAVEVSAERLKQLRALGYVD